MKRKILPSAYAIREGMIVEFTYPSSQGGDKLRRVSVERVVGVNSRYTAPLAGMRAYINGPELTDGGQIKSFNHCKIIGEVTVID